jgi:hypothetical protein
MKAKTKAWLQEVEAHKTAPIGYRNRSLFRVQQANIAALKAEIKGDRK